MTRAEIRTEFYNEVEERLGTASVKWVKATVNTWIDDSLNEYNYQTGQITESSTATIQANNTYAEPAGMLYIKEMWFDSIYEVIAKDDQELVQRLGEDSDTVPDYFVEDQRDPGNLKLYPTPSDTTKTFETIWVKKISALAGDSSEPPFRGTHKAHVYYCCFRAFDRPGKHYDKDKSRYYWALFMREAGRTGARAPSHVVHRTTGWGSAYQVKRRQRFVF